MRIIDVDTEDYLQALALSVRKDPASLDTWRCIHIHGTPQDSTLKNISWEPLLHGMEEEFARASCDVVICADHELLIIGKSTQLEAMQALQEKLFFNLGYAAERVEWHLYDMFYGWRDIMHIVLSKLPEDAAIHAYDDEADFGETHSLTEVFNTAKRLQTSRQPLHILLVEDDEMTCRLVTSLFKDRYAIFTAHNAHDAVSQYMQHAPDIVFLDINLPDHNGFQVLQKMLSYDPDAYIVMFSGNSYLDNIVHALGAGAAGFVAKPFTSEKMRHYIEDCAMARHGK